MVTISQLNFYFPKHEQDLQLVWLVQIQDVTCPLGWCASREHIDINGYFLCYNWSQTTSLEVARSLITTLHLPATHVSVIGY
jgi:hypothetical protein